MGRHVTRRPDPLLKELKEWIRNIMKDEKSTPADKLRAVDLGTKLLLIEHKIRDDDDDAGFFDK